MVSCNTCCQQKHTERLKGGDPLGRGRWTCQPKVEGKLEGRRVRVKNNKLQKSVASGGIKVDTGIGWRS